MSSLRVIFNSAFTGNSHNSDNGGNSNNPNHNNTTTTNNNSNYSNTMTANQQQYGGNKQYNYISGIATNLTETNNKCVARQSNLVDEINAMKKQERYLNPREFFVSAPNESVDSLTDEMLSDLNQRVNNMTMTDRQEAQNDIYGLGARNQEEDPWQLNVWMNEMDDVIRKGIIGNDKRFSALRLAMHTHGDGNDMSGVEYIQSQKLKFLRAANWVVEDAVNRISSFFELKLEYFGSTTLTRDLTTKDLNPIDIELWKQHGFLQLSEDRDAYGRAIMVFITKKQFSLPIATVLRCILYLSTIMTRDESLQLAGCVLLFWTVGQEFTINARARLRAKLIVQTYAALPIRGIARHVCYNPDSAVRDLFSILAWKVQPWGSIRMKLHSGTAMECFYNLMTFGIPRNATPINNEGEVELDFHNGFLEAIERKEIDDQKRRRQERLDKQIQQMQLQNQVQFNNNPMSNNIVNNKNTDTNKNNFNPAMRGDPYQREPPVMPMGEGIDESERSSSLLSWNMGELTGMDPFSLRSEEMEGLPEDFLKRLFDIGNSGTSSTGMVNNSQIIDSTTSSSNHLILQPQPLLTVPKSIPEPTPIAKNITSSLITPKQAKFKIEDKFILIPGVFDVIMGRGRHNKKKPGNRKLNDLLEAFQDEYEASDKFQKTVLSEVVVSKMIEDGSRFLVREGEKNNSMWVEVSLEKARDKVAHDFRNLRRAKKASMTGPDSSTLASGANEVGAPKRQRSVGNATEGQNGFKTKKASSSMPTTTPM